MGVPAGPWYIDDTLTFTAITHRFDTGALTDADAVPAYRIYEDETGTAILTGNTAKLDDAGTTGFYSEQITLSAANGFEVGKSYSIYVSAAVNSVTGGQTFNFKVIAEALRPTTSGRTLDVSAGGEAGIDWANIGSPTTAVNLSATNIDTDQVVASVSGAVGSVTGAVGSVTGAVGSVAAGGITAASFAANAITAAKLDPDVTTELQAGLATSSAVATLQTSVDDLPTNAELATSQAAADDATLAAIATVQTSVDDLPTNAELATALGTADDAVLAQVALVKAKTDLIPGTQDGKTFAETTLLIASAVLGKASGLDTATAVYRAVDDSKDRITATVDANGNRTAVTLDAG
jgi:hypothetical protein